MKEITIEKKYQREDGLTVTNFEFPDNFILKERSIVRFPAKSKGGNHKHPRTEIFISMGKLTLVWENQRGEIERTEMTTYDEDGKLRMFIIPPHLPHAVVNDTEDEVVIIEFADDEQKDVVAHKIA